jgi:GT2 family glycosyltransferase
MSSKIETYAPVSVLAVVVLYHKAIHESSTVRSLIAQRDVTNGALLSTLIYDNATRSPPAHIPDGFDYVADASNGGIFAAYARALHKAIELESEWLLLLDEDSDLSPDFIARSCSYLRAVAADRSVAAVVPHVQSAGNRISPCHVKVGHILRPARSNLIGRLERETTAVGSGVLIRRDFVEEIGGFNRQFWLDYQDHWLFNRIYATGYRVFVTDLKLDHDLSISRFNRRISYQRYIGILEAEGRFFDDYKSRLDRFVYLLRLIVRIVKLSRLRQRGYCRAIAAQIPGRLRAVLR